MIRFALLSVLLLLSTIAVAQAPPASRVWVKIIVQNVRPIEMQEMLPRGPWWNTREGTGYRNGASGVPPLVDQVLAFDVDKSVLVRSTPEALGALKQETATLDVPLPRVRFKTHIVPVLRTPDALSPERAAYFARVMEKDAAVANHVGERLQAGPNAYNQMPFPRGPYSGPPPGPEFWGTSITAIPHVHENGSVSFLFELNYWASSEETRRFARRVNRLRPGDITRMTFPVDDPKHPVAAYRLAVTLEGIEAAPPPSPTPAPPLLVLTK